jgi:hypothetical protein
MELYELGMALSVVLIAAVMDLLDTSTELHRKPDVPALPCGPVGAVGSPHPGPDARSRRRHRRRPEPTTDAGAAHHLLPPTCCSRRRSRPLGSEDKEDDQHQEPMPHNLKPHRQVDPTWGA